jgi:hypothetical protein
LTYSDLGQVYVTYYRYVKEYMATFEQHLSCQKGIFNGIATDIVNKYFNKVKYFWSRINGLPDMLIVCGRRCQGMGLPSTAIRHLSLRIKIDMYLLISYVLRYDCFTLKFRFGILRRRL